MTDDALHRSNDFSVFLLALLVFFVKSVLTSFIFTSNQYYSEHLITQFLPKPCQSNNSWNCFLLLVIYLEVFSTELGLIL